MAKSKYRKIKAIIFIMLIVVSISAFLFADYLNYDTQTIKSLISQNYYPSVLIFLILIILATITTLPISAASIPGVLVFSIVNTIFYVMVGIVIGAFLLYYLSKWSGRKFINEYAELKGGRLKAFNELIHKNSFRFVILLNFVYFFPSNLAHMVAGITNLKISKFLFATIVGNFINTFSVILLIFGIINKNTTHIILGVLILSLPTILVIYIFRHDIKDIIILSFNEKAYKKLSKFSKSIKK